jgi:DNA-binding transcriptional regulator YdaS (Cro superfamily)
MDEAPLTGLKAALQTVAGNKAALGRKLGLTRATITQWGDTVPITWIEKVEAATGVHRSILRPDLGFERQAAQQDAAA